MVIDPQRRAREASLPSDRFFDRLPLRLAATGLSILVGQGSLAQTAANANAGAPRDPWRVQSSLSLMETYSDNINLAPSGSERSDLVTTISPSLRVTRLSPRLTLNLGYSPQLLYYASGTNGTTIHNYLDAAANATLVQNLLYFDAQGNVSQQNVSPFGALAANTVNGSSNRVETRSFSLGPSIRSRLGNDLSYRAGYRYSTTSSDSNALSRNNTDQIYGVVETSTSFRDLGVSANFDRTDIRYGGQNEILTENIGTTLTYVVSPTLRLRAGVGYDRNDYPSFPDRNLDGPSYFGGFDWTPSRNTGLNAQIGHRYFGNTANILFTQRTPRTVFNVSYTRDQTTSSQSFGGLVANPNYALLDQLLQASIPDPVRRAQAVTATLSQAGLPTSRFDQIGFVSNQLYLQKRFDVSLALLGVRNTVTFDVYRSESQALSALSFSNDVFNQSQSFRQRGASATWTYRLGPRTTTTVTAQKLRNESLVGTANTRQRIVTASVNRQIGRRTSGSLQYRNSRQDGSGVGSGNYHENALIGSIRFDY